MRGSSQNQCRPVALRNTPAGLRGDREGELDEGASSLGTRRTCRLRAANSAAVFCRERNTIDEDIRIAAIKTMG